MNKKNNDFSLDDDFSLPDEPIDEPVLPDIESDSEQEFSLDVNLDLELPPMGTAKGDSLDDIVAGLDYSDYDEEEDDSYYTSGSKISHAIGANSALNVSNSDDETYDNGDDYYYDDDEDDDSDYPFDAPEFSDDDDEFDFSTSLRGDTRDGLNIDNVLIKAIEMKASDVHINSDGYVAFTVLGDIVHMKDYGIIPARAVQQGYLNIVTHQNHSLFAENLELDTSYMIRHGEYKGRRFRLSVGRSMGNIFMVFRVISDNIPTPDDLGVPDTLKKWTQLPNGLVLICGPTGTGKSTTFASLINQINQYQTKKIITVERPVEYVYPNDGTGLITQREVGLDSRSFFSALTSAMRQAPDVIMIGEVRDREEVDSLLRASESGHLAFSTMHTSTPPGTINRIKSLYEGDEQLRVLSSLKDNVRGIANQVLLKTKDGRGRFALHCSLDVTPEISEMIGEGDVGAIQDHMLKNKQTLEHILVKAVVDGKCDIEEARSKSVFPATFDSILEQELKGRKRR